MFLGIFPLRRRHRIFLLPPIKKRYSGVIGVLYSVVKLAYCMYCDGFGSDALGFVTENRWERVKLLNYRYYGITHTLNFKQ